MASYSYLRGGKQHGPYTLAQLQQLAAAGQLAAEDLVQRQGADEWLPASGIPELRFASPAAGPARPVPDVERGRSVPPPLPRDAAQGGAVAAAPSDKVAAFKSAAGRAWTKTRFAASHGVEAVQKATGLDRVTTIALLAGAAALILLAFCTPFTWFSFGVGLSAFGMDVAEGETWKGLHYFEGKFVVFLVIVALVWCGLGLLRRSWLATGLLVAGGVATCSAVMLVGLRSRIADLVAEHRRTYESLLNNPMFGEMYKQSKLEAPAWLGFALNLAILLALGAAGAFVIAGTRERQPLKFFPDKGPFVERYGWLIGSQVLAFLAGVIIAVWQH